MSKELKSISKFMSLVLRHKPEEIGLQLDVNGWADVDELIEKMNEKASQSITKELIEEVVESNEKKRFVFNEDHTRIRANQGHSIEVDLQLTPTTPPAILYHGTAKKHLASIMATGLNKASRHHVHLSANIDTAKQVGQRHGKPVVLLIDAQRMFTDGLSFYVSENNVWLTEEVNIMYLSINE